MKSWSTAGASALGLLLTLGAGGLQAQTAATAGLPPLPGSVPPPARRATLPRRTYRVAFQDAPAAPAASAAPSTPSPTTPDASAPAAPAAPATGAGADVTSSNRDLSLPRAEREGGGGEPTNGAAAADTAKSPDSEKPADAAAPAKDPTKLLMKLFDAEESPVKVYGWLQNSYTYNGNGRAITGGNFGVTPNFKANQWMGNQYYLIAENPLEQGDKVNFGFRVDNLFGNDWQFNHAHSTFDGSYKLDHFAGYDPAQYYAEVHLPILTKGGLDIKGGRWYSLVGYEVVPATGRPLLSVPMMFNYGQPFTHNGVISTLHVNERVNLYNGAVNGWDRNWNTHYKYSYIGGFSWTSKSGNTSFTTIVITGPNQYPTFPGNKTQIILPGNTELLNPGFQAGRANLGYATDNRTIFTNVLTQKWGKKLTQVVENDDAYEQNVPGIGPGGTSKNASWYSLGNWFLYAFSDKFTGVWRSEIFRDNSGVRTGFADTFYTQTLGFIYKPKPYIWVRPEARYDWAQFTSPYNNGTRRSQLTLAFDVILLF